MNFPYRIGVGSVDGEHALIGPNCTWTALLGSSRWHERQARYISFATTNHEELKRAIENSQRAIESLIFNGKVSDLNDIMLENKKILALCQKHDEEWVKEGSGRTNMRGWF
jgi:hypothetical protein